MRRRSGRTDRRRRRTPDRKPGVRPCPHHVRLADRQELREIGREWAHRIDIRTAKTDDQPADALLIRPDGHIAWAATIGEPADTAAPTLCEALSHWFGAAAVA
ncbi:hypothetical protein [Nocardia lijiangensis]|uniref:aromatic-ring hydroxylase C-terminal domain-containing protein n=1 Tax=Nocardia lijiangensis TaxID=299618 RepID=UPI0008348B17|nr:hypothetical protein [Nocardia lijiangensis]